MIRHDLPLLLAQDDGLSGKTIVVDWVVTDGRKQSLRGAQDATSVESSRLSSKVANGGGGVRSYDALLHRHLDGHPSPPGSGLPIAASLCQAHHPDSNFRQRLHRSGCRVASLW